MGMGIAPVGMNMPQQTQGQGKGGGGRSAFNQRLMQLPGMAESLQASQQRMAQDPNANMMRTQPALPAGYDPNVHQRGFGVMMDNPLQAQPSQTPSEIPAGMQGDQLRAQQNSFDALNAARQAGFQVGPTPNQPSNPYANMDTGQLQQMNEMARQQQMMQQRGMMPQRSMQPFMPPQQQFGFNQFPMGNPMFGGLGALMAMGGYGGKGGGGFSQPQMGGSFAPAMFQGLGGFFR